MTQDLPVTQRQDPGHRVVADRAAAAAAHRAATEDEDVVADRPDIVGVGQHLVPHLAGLLEVATDAGVPVVAAELDLDAGQRLQFDVLVVEAEQAPDVPRADRLERLSSDLRVLVGYRVHRQGVSSLQAKKGDSMALRDTWHRTLVYFGLAEEEDPRYEPVREPEPESELEDRYRDRPNVRRLQRRRRDEIDDIFADEPRSGGRETRVLRPVGGNGRGGGDIQVHLVIPKSFNDAQQIADQFKDQVPVILNLQQTDTDLSKRLIDFASGLTYALDGGMQRIADKVFLLPPRNVEVSAEERARLIEKGFFNQS